MEWGFLEIHELTNDSIRKDIDGIYYFDILKSKTTSGIRKIPIHKDILDRVLKIDFPILKDFSDNAAQKAILKVTIQNNWKNWEKNISYF